VFCSHLKLRLSVKTACLELKAKILTFDRNNYRIAGWRRASEINIASFPFFVYLSPKGKESYIEVYDGLPVHFKPEREFLEALMITLSKNISLTFLYDIDKVEREKTYDGWVILKEGDDSIWSHVTPKLFKKMDYEIKIIEAADQNIKKVKKLVIRSGLSNFAIYLKKNDHSDSLLVIPFRDIKEIKTIPISRNYYLGRKTIAILSISFERSNIENTKIVSNNNSNASAIEENHFDTLVLDSGPTLYTLLNHLRIVKEIDKDVNSRTKLLAMLNGIIICTKCYKNSS